ncbi:uncharacterized protein [Tursiops truncatus]|uniref:Translation initiation factor IF-2-like n=1 Tax=Tursiops truncatus TaxID=9739 RepID=A0A6J3RJH5_TURTR|nr:uncharacterized protein LOC115863117 [Globicephala melas]XP_033714800.1 translation initiation factor IF-2-like [Tursiops truncatus]
MDIAKTKPGRAGGRYGRGAEGGRGQPLPRRGCLLFPTEAGPQPPGSPRRCRRRRLPLAHRAGPSSSSSQLRVPAAVATAAAATAAANATVDSDSVPGRRTTAAAATASAASGLPPAAEAAPAAGAILLVCLLFLLLLLRPVARCPRPLPLPRAPARPRDWGGHQSEAPPSRGGASRRAGRAREQTSESPATNAREGGWCRLPPGPGAHHPLSRRTGPPAPRRPAGKWPDGLAK